MNSKRAEVQGRVTVSSHRKCLRLSWRLSLCLFITGGAIVYLFLDKTSRVDDNGILHEPLWGLVPLSVFFMSVAAVLALFDLMLSVCYRKH